MAAIVLATRIAADADRGFLDIALTTPIARTTYVAVGVARWAIALLAFRQRDLAA